MCSCVHCGVVPDNRHTPTALFSTSPLHPLPCLDLALKLVHPFELPVPLPEPCEFALRMQVELGPRVNEVRDGAILVGTDGGAVGRGWLQRSAYGVSALGDTIYNREPQRSCGDAMGPYPHEPSHNGPIP